MSFTCRMFGGMVCVPESLKIKKEVDKVGMEGEKKPGSEEEESEEEEEEEQSGKQEGQDERPDNEEGMTWQLNSYLFLNNRSFNRSVKTNSFHHNRIKILLP